MTREELDHEFLGFEWECGFTYGVDGRAWVAAVANCRRNMGRDLTALERALFAAGFMEGVRDRAKWIADQERIDDDGMRGAIALAIPF